MKKILALLILVLILTAAACGAETVVTTDDGIKVTAHDGAVITNLDTQRNEDGTVSMVLEWD